MRKVILSMEADEKYERIKRLAEEHISTSMLLLRLDVPFDMETVY